VTNFIHKPLKKSRLSEKLSFLHDSTVFTTFTHNWTNLKIQNLINYMVTLPAQYEEIYGFFTLISTLYNFFYRQKISFRINLIKSLLESALNSKFELDSRRKCLLSKFFEINMRHIGVIWSLCPDLLKIQISYDSDTGEASDNEIIFIKYCGGCKVN